MKYGFGVDIGGTTIKIGLFSVDGDLLEKWEIPTNKTDNGAVSIFSIPIERDRLSAILKSATYKPTKTKENVNSLFLYRCFILLPPASYKLLRPRLIPSRLQYFFHRMKSCYSLTYWHNHGRTKTESGKSPSF